MGSLEARFLAGGARAEPSHKGVLKDFDNKNSSRCVP